MDDRVAVRPQVRRRVPLRSTCAEPHACPRPVRMRALAQVELFAGLTDEQLVGVDVRMTSLSFAEGDALYTAGAPATHLYVLVAGRTVVSRPTPDGRDVVVDLLGPGDLVGALRTEGRHAYRETVRAVTTTCALRLGTDAFREVLAEHPGVALRVIDGAAAVLDRARTGATEQSTTTVAQRVARTLLRLADTFGQESASGTTLIQLPLSRADLAGMTGSTPESVSRVMSRLRKDGVIESGRRWTAVVDRERLARTAAD